MKAFLDLITRILQAIFPFLRPSPPRPELEEPKVTELDPIIIDVSPPKPPSPRTAIWPAVREVVYAFSRAKEGNKLFPYADHKGFATAGIGHLCNSLQALKDMPWKVDGRPATEAELQAGLDAVHANKALYDHGGADAFLPITKLRLTQMDVDTLFWKDFSLYVREMKKRFPGFYDYPACAQFALISLSYACGTNFEFPKFEAAVKRRDWVTAAEEIWMDEKKTKGVHERNVANRALMQEAAMIERTGADPSVIRFRLV